MSERPREIPEAQPAPLIESAVVVPVRPGRDGWELLLGLRSRRSRFFPGHWSCPGGRLDPEDHPEREGAHARCAARELAEETGISIAFEKLWPIGVRTTPPYQPLRYRSPFFLALLPAETKTPEQWPSPEENEAFRFFPAALALRLWEEGSLPAPPPLPPIIRVLAEAKGVTEEELAHRLAQDNDRDLVAPRFEFVAGLWYLPVKSPTLPPSTHTNVWMPGSGPFALVDPGCAEDEEVARLLAVVNRKRELGAEPAAVLLTHHHRDHAASAGRISRELKIPLYAHPETLIRLRDIEEGRPLLEGEALKFGDTELKVLHLPGHAPGHLVFLLQGTGQVLCGDVVSSVSTILIDPADGDMGRYMESLRLLADLNPQRLFAGHGPPAGPELIEATLRHRQDRERRIEAVLGFRPRPLEDIASEAYQDTPEAHPELARRQTLAHLLDLARQGRARATGGGTYARA